jgi:hypothetical protein
MIKYALLAASVSLALASAGLAAPLSPTPQLKQSSSSGLVQVRYWRRHPYYWRRPYYRRHYYRGRYWYGGRYWGRRYYYRPYYWRSWGCINIGPVWYCP